MSRTVRAHTAHHLAGDFACPPETVWDYTIATMAEGAMFAGQGSEIEPITDDPAAILGGYRVSMPADPSGGGVICHITERDETAMRLSLYSKVPSPTGVGRMTILASYHVVPAGAHCHYSIDSHADLDVAIGEDASSAEIASAIHAVRTRFDEGLRAGFATIKAQLEAAQSQS